MAYSEILELLFSNTMTCTSVAANAKRRFVPTSQDQTVLGSQSVNNPDPFFEHVVLVVSEDDLLSLMSFHNIVVTHGQPKLSLWK